MKKHIPIILLLIASLVLRLYQLGNVPWGLYGDELENGYQAWSLGTTLADYQGRFLPFFLKNLYEWRYSLLPYISAPFVTVSQTIFAVRLPVAIISTLSIWLMYLVLTNLKKPAFWGALFFALSPWSFHFGRGSFEGSLMLFLILLVFWMFQKYMDTKKVRYALFLPLAALSLYSYPIAVLFMPLFVTALIIIYRPNLKALIPAGVMSLIIGLPFIVSFFSGISGSRFAGIGVVSDSYLGELMAVRRATSWLTVDIWEKIFVNRYLTGITVLVKQFLTVYSPQFLFLNGDPLLRHQVLGFGVLPWVLLPLVLIGFYRMFDKKTIDEKLKYLLLVWLAIAPLGSILTVDGGNHAIRLLPVFPALMIVATIGLSYLKRPIYYFIIVLALTVNLGGYYHEYFSFYSVHSRRYYLWAFKETMPQLAPYLASAKRVFVNNTYEPSLIPFAFYTKLPPVEFQKMLKDTTPTEILPHFIGFQFGEKYYFGQIVLGPTSLYDFLEPGDLYYAVQLKDIPGDLDLTKENMPADLKVLYQFRDVNGDLLITVVQKQ